MAEIIKQLDEEKVIRIQAEQRKRKIREDNEKLHCIWGRRRKWLDSRKKVQ